MSGLLTSRSDRKRTLHSHSHAQAFETLINKKSEVDEEDITQYAEAEEAAEEALDIKSFSQDTEACHESENDTSSSQATRAGARSSDSSMPRMSPDDMISMTLEDLMTFCQRMNACQNDEANTPAGDFKSEIHEY
ncbi:hypothetical protein AJ78_06375 [Emergomyces pasteurianus Ep9510]|uniref:Uncharacterized protein n=1 Tax=Emergomyces pasteurianus Ep9510 TaxID=1447872 RepID=A0A1J9PAZ5_9EURO|nr:hypothetical protein AJ78_06375 [Emergomyces pasteurianus Ep9510]